MAEVKWIKLDTDIFNNRKIRQIEKMPDGDTMVVIWLKILTLAGHVNDGGCIYITRDIPYTDQLLATEFDRPLQTIQMALEVFRQFGMVDLHSNVLHVTNWEEYQNIEGMERIREQTRKRVANYRERKKIESNVTVTQCNATDIDIEIDKEKEIDIEKPKRTKFVPPTLEEVKAYCVERGNQVDPERFVDYYASQNWTKANGRKVQDWKACIRQWEKDKPAVNGTSETFKNALRRTKQ